MAKKRLKNMKKCDRELNIFYDTSDLRLNNFAHQQKLHTLIIIGQSEITSLEVIVELKHLRELWIVESHLKDVMALKTIISLRRLYLYSNEIQEIPDFSNIKQLKIVSLATNEITDLEGIRDLTSLRDLNVANNKIQKISNIFAPNSKVSHINLSGNPLYDLQDLENLWVLKNLKRIEFADPIYGECPLIASLYNYRRFLIHRLPRLCEIDYYPIGLEERENASNNELSINEKMLHKYNCDGSLDLKIFTKILNSNEFLLIKQLNIVDCSISEADLQNISLPQLESLDLSKNRIESLKGLKGLKNLHTLCMSYNELGGSKNDMEEASSIDSEVTEFPNLIVFYADHNKIRSIVDANIPKMPLLKYIFLQYNKINDLDGIEDFPSLNIAILDHNKIESIDDDQFSWNSDMRTLFLENNKLTCLSFVKKLSTIEKLFIANNKIADKRQITNLSFLQNLRELTIMGNPLCNRYNHYREIFNHIETIRMIDGHIVSH